MIYYFKYYVLHFCNIFIYIIYIIMIVYFVITYLCILKDIYIRYKNQDSKIKF